MFDITTELFLNTYFKFDAMIGRFINDKYSLFESLCSVFFIPDSDKEELFASTKDSDLCEIETFSDYARHCRIQQYLKLIGSATLPRDKQNIFSLKGEALEIVKDVDLDYRADASDSKVYGALCESVNMGIVHSMCALGFLQCHGYGVEKDIQQAQKYFETVAKWNDIDGILFALKYGENTQKNIDRLYTVTKGTRYEVICDRAKAFYNVSEVHISPENELLQKLFGVGILKSEIVDPKCSRLIDSDIISIKEKERLLFSCNKELISDIASLPLKLHEQTVKFDDTPIAQNQFMQEKGREMIGNKYADCSTREKKPLCICSESQYMLNLYKTALRGAFSSANVCEIVVSDLNDYDFEQTRDNIFVKSCDENKTNVYLISFDESVSSMVEDRIKNFLQSDKRKNFRLFNPNVTIDLSSIIPICFCNKQNSKMLTKFCDMLTLTPVSTAEKESLLDSMLQSKAEQLSIESVQIDNEARAMLKDESVDGLERIIGHALMSKQGADTVVITAEMCKKEMGKHEIAKQYGFGGKK